MSDTDRLEQALKALREADAGRRASDATGTRLRAAFRDHHARRRRWAAMWGWAAVTACAASIAVAVWLFRSPAQPGTPAQQTTATVTVTPPVEPAPEPVTAALPAPPKKLAAKPQRPRARPRPRREEPEVEEFIALPYAPPFTAHDHGQVMRVQLPRQSLRSMGLPVNEDRLFERVPADLLLGEDGVPRAIRFTSYR